MKNLVCFLEEPSAKEMLIGVLPRLLPDNIEYTYIVFDGKQDLEKQLLRKLRGWLKPNSVFLVMRDQDSSDCYCVKEKLQRICKESGKSNVIVRIACHELESFYFGDLAAVEKGLGINNLVKHKRKSKYRNPDDIINPCDELEKLTGGIYQNVMGSRSIAPFLSLENNTSNSYKVLLSGVKRLLN